jgi:hypothetical protein
VKKTLTSLGTAFLIVSIFLALFSPTTFADFWVWTGTHIASALTALISRIPHESTRALAAITTGVIR